MIGKYTTKTFGVKKKLRERGVISHVTKGVRGRAKWVRGPSG